MIYTKPDGGLAFWLVPKQQTDLFQVAAHLEKKGIQMLTPDKFSFSEPIMGLRLGYASLTEEQLEEGIIEIGKLL